MQLLQIQDDEFKAMTIASSGGIYCDEMIQLISFHDLSIRTKNVGYLNVLHELKYQQTTFYFDRILRLSLWEGGEITL